MDMNNPSSQDGKEHDDYIGDPGGSQPNHSFNDKTEFYEGKTIDNKW